MTELPQNGLDLGITGIFGVGEQHRRVVSGTSRGANDPFLVNVTATSATCPSGLVTGRAQISGNPWRDVTRPEPV